MSADTPHPSQRQTPPADQPVIMAGPDIDRASEVPDFARYLLPGERVINVQHTDIKRPKNIPSAAQALNLLTGSSTHGDIGEHGPSVAARTTPENAGKKNLQLFEVVFGRDSLRVALDLLKRYPKLAHATIHVLAENQGITTNDHSGEEPGRIIHELRDLATDPIAQELHANMGWDWPYYESIDATPMFITAIKRYCKQEGEAILAEMFTARDGQVRTIGEALDAAVDWLLERLGRNAEGLLEFRRLMDDCPETWRDSWDSFSHADGTIANHRQWIASVEVQALAYDALLDAARVYRHGRPHPERATLLEDKAALLEQQIMKLFWVEDAEHFGGYFAHGTDRDDAGNLRQLRIRTSDMGHLLNSRLLDPTDAETSRRRDAVIRNLFCDTMLNASGIRSLATTEARYRPGAYHNGNVWLWETFYIAQGLERHGYYGLAFDLKSRIWRVTDVTHKFPEFAMGGAAAEPVLNARTIDVWGAKDLRFIWDKAAGRKTTRLGGANRVEQPPQEIQAWTVAAILASKLEEEDPLHPGSGIPHAAIDPDKLAFEQSVLDRLAKT